MCRVTPVLLLVLVGLGGCESEELRRERELIAAEEQARRAEAEARWYNSLTPEQQFQYDMEMERRRSMLMGQMLNRAMNPPPIPAPTFPRYHHFNYWTNDGRSGSVDGWSQ